MLQQIALWESLCRLTICGALWLEAGYYPLPLCPTSRDTDHLSSAILMVHHDRKLSLELLNGGQKLLMGRELSEAGGRGIIMNVMEERSLLQEAKHQLPKDTAV